MATTRITVKNDGSLRVEGDFEILDSAGRAFGLAARTAPTGGPSVGLCRCGHSANKPFCDGAHRVHGFDSKVVAFDLEPPARQ
jgi:CDGSH-type Zn-finger protein